MASPKKIKVEALRAFFISSPLIAIQPVKRAFDFAKWLGHFPLSITTNRLGLVTYRFVGCHFATILWLFTLALQGIIITAQFNQLRRFATTATITLLLYIHLISYYCASVLVPRLGVFRAHLLESGLNDLIDIHALLSVSPANSVSFIMWVVIVVLEVTTVLPDIVWGLTSSDRPTVFGPHPLYRIGTDNFAFGILVQNFIKIYCNVSYWIMPLQFFSVFRHTAMYFATLGAKIAEVPCVGARGESLGEKGVLVNQDMRRNLEDQLRVINAALVKLVKAVNALNAYFGLPMLLFLTTRFLNIVGNLHFSASLASHLTAGSYSKLDVLNSLRSLTRDISGFLFVIWVGDFLPSAVAELKQQTWEMPYVAANSHLGMWDLEKRSSGAYFQWIRNQIGALQVNIDAFGFFTIGRKIIPPILGAITTYFLIIVQYASSDPVIDSAKVNLTSN